MISTGVGTFTATLNSLVRSTTYYARAFVTNEVGTSYGVEISFTTPASSMVSSGGKVVYSGDYIIEIK